MRTDLRGAVIVWAAALVTAAHPASAHLPIAIGSVVGLIREADHAVIATVTRQSGNGRVRQIEAHVAKLLAGDGVSDDIRFEAQLSLETGRRYLFLLDTQDSKRICIQGTGTVLPAEPESDQAYARLVTAVRGIDPSDPRIDDSLIAALSAPAPELRRYAAYELVARHHGEHRLTPERAAVLAKTIAPPEFDADLRQALEGLTRPAAAGR